MQHTLSSIRSALAPDYPESEITGFTRLIFKKVCGYTTADLILYKNNILSDSTRTKIESIVKRLTLHEPIQYILGETEFMGFTFLTAPGVLIPRPETEELVDLIVRENGQDPVRILDIGTGSGCIAISLARLLPTASVSAWDISPAALEIARTNNRSLHAGVSFGEVDILQPDAKPDSGPFDILVSNPPYVCFDEKTGMEQNVLLYEPHTALFVPDDDPLLFYRAIARSGRTLLAPQGKIYFEINSRFGPQTTELLQQLGYVRINLHQDISGRDRMISAANA